MVSKKLLLHTILPLVLGFAIYLFFHKPNLIIHSYTNKVFLFPNYYDSVKSFWLGKFLLNHVPDILWAYSLGVFLINTTWFINNTYWKAAFILLIVSFTEIVQVFYPNTFTFDWIDLLLIIITQVFIFYRYESKQKY